MFLTEGLEGYYIAWFPLVAVPNLFKLHVLVC